MTTEDQQGRKRPFLTAVDSQSKRDRQDSTKELEDHRNFDKPANRSIENEQLPGESLNDQLAGAIGGVAYLR